MAVQKSRRSKNKTTKKHLIKINLKKNKIQKQMYFLKWNVDKYICKF